MSETPESLYDRIGGAETVSRLIDAFYARVLNDPELRPFFENTSVERLTEMQKEFFSAALDGPVHHSDLDLAHVHHGRGIERSHFTRYVNHLIGVLEEADVISKRDAMEVVHRISTFVYEITGRAGTSGD